MNKFKHVEAYCFMEYTCEKNHKHIEILWNSRDGVTPFIIQCNQCDGMMQHSNWHYDTRYVSNTLNHLKDGQRYFVDIDEKLYIENIKKLIEEYKSDEEYIKYLKNNIYKALNGRFREVVNLGEPGIKTYKKEVI